MTFNALPPWNTAWSYYYGTAPAATYQSYRLKLVTPPEDPAITFEAACAHLRIDPTSPEGVTQQPLIEAMIAAATGEVQRYCSLALLTQAWKLTGTDLVSPLLLPKAPLQAVTNVTDSDGNVVDPTKYTVVADERLPGSISGVTGGATIEFTAGWEEADAIPPELVQAMLLMIGSWHMNRESVQAFTLFAIPGVVGVEAILDNFRLDGFA